MERLRELRGSDTRERELANILGFEHSRAVRWKEGQMYVDRAEYLLRLADTLEVEPMLLVGLSSGQLSVEQAQRQLARAGRSDDGSRRRRGSVAVYQRGQGGIEAEDMTLVASGPKDGARATVVLVATSGEGRKEFADAIGSHGDLAGLVATGLPVGVSLAERYRPELTFLDLGAANVHAFDTCRLLSSLTTRSQRKCRVVAGTSNVTDTVEKSALMAGAAHVTLFPFTRHVLDTELDRLEERLGPRKKK